RTENLDLLVLANRTLGDEVTDGDVTALGVELGETLEVDDLVLDPERVLEATQLGRAHHRIQVAALESDANLVAGLRALGSTARGLTLGCFTTTHAGLRRLGAGRRAEVVHLEHLRTRLSLRLGLGRRLGRGGLLGGSLGLGLRLSLRGGRLRGSSLGGGLRDSSLRSSSLGGSLRGSSLRSGGLGCSLRGGSLRGSILLRRSLGGSGLGCRGLRCGLLLYWLL